MRRSVICSVAILLMSQLSFLGQPLRIVAQTEQVQLTISDTALELEGYAAPKALVTFTDNNSAIATVTANASGYFSRTLSSQPTGIRNITASYIDKNSTTSVASTKSVSVSAEDVTTLGYFLSPTINRQTAAESIKGSIVQINGYTAANATVTMSLGMLGTERIAISDANGFYEFLVDSSNLQTERYIASVVSDVAGSLQISDTSYNITFSAFDPQEGRSHNYWLMILLVLAISPFSYYAYKKGKELMPKEEN